MSRNELNLLFCGTAHCKWLDVDTGATEWPREPEQRIKQPYASGKVCTVLCVCRLDGRSVRVHASAFKIIFPFKMMRKEFTQAIPCWHRLYYMRWYDASYAVIGIFEPNNLTKFFTFAPSTWNMELCEKSSKHPFAYNPNHIVRAIPNGSELPWRKNVQPTTKHTFVIQFRKFLRQKQCTICSSERLKLNIRSGADAKAEKFNYNFYWCMAYGVPCIFN